MSLSFLTYLFCSQSDTYCITFSQTHLQGIQVAEVQFQDLLALWLFSLMPSVRIMADIYVYIHTYTESLKTELFFLLISTLWWWTKAAHRQFHEVKSTAREPPKHFSISTKVLMKNEHRCFQCSPALYSIKAIASCHISHRMNAALKGLTPLQWRCGTYWLFIHKNYIHVTYILV